MKKYISLGALVLLLVFSSAFKGSKMLGLGAKAPMTDYSMQGTDGKKYNLAQLKGEKGLLVIFSCNTCPFVLAWEDQYPRLGKLTQEMGIGMVLVNSNTRKRKNENSMEAMQKHFKEAGYNTPYVIDQNNKLADAFGAKTTPHVFLFNDDLELVYRGSINDKYENQSKQAEKFYLEEALKALEANQEIDPADTREIGCSIKRQ